jgi:glycosyltransferase involved in cell wall biosynthesis
MAHIVTVYNKERLAAVQPQDMAHIRWIKMSEALARLGHRVDMATAEHRFRLRKPIVQINENLRRVPLSQVRWADYDVVKSLFHQGFETLERHGGATHPFIIAKLGSVVSSEDAPGIYFYGRQRERMFATQQRIHERARYVTTLSPAARDLWIEKHGARDGMLLVPGAADAAVPVRGPDPFPATHGIRCVFSGNLYHEQPEATRVLVAKLNELGRRLQGRGRLFVVGPGDASGLDRRHVTYLGVVPYDRSWDHLHFAHVGVVVSAGPFMHNNESTKIYHYLRVGLPVVSESGFPNGHVLLESGLGVITEAGDLQAMADQVCQVAAHPGDRDRAIQYILTQHTWDRRAAIYDAVLRRHFPAVVPSSSDSRSPAPLSL